MTAIDTPTLHAMVPFSAGLGLEVRRADPEAVGIELAWRPELCTAGGVLHGGALMTLADTAGAVLAFLNLPDGAGGTTTVESKTNLLRAVTSGTVVATSTPLHRGRSLIVLETELRAGDALVAKTTQTQAVLGAR